MHGHRHPIAAVKLMCERAATEREHRALTVDEQGEFRLWNIYVRERASEALKVPVLQTFHMQNPEVPLCNFRWIGMPENGERCVAEYNDFFACSTKLMHFLPGNNTVNMFNTRDSQYLHPYAQISTLIYLMNIFTLL